MTRFAGCLAFAATLFALAASNAGAKAARSPAIVLGSAVYAGSNGAGWGKPHPPELYNGGDPSGLISHIHWSSWGARTASGRGRNAIFRPTGGYYRKLVPIELRAYDRGQCVRHGVLAYQRLSFREPSRPGGPFGRWQSWSGSKTLCRFGF